MYDREKLINDDEYLLEVLKKEFINKDDYIDFLIEFSDKYDVDLNTIGDVIKKDKTLSKILYNNAVKNKKIYKKFTIEKDGKKYTRMFIPKQNAFDGF